MAYTIQHTAIGPAPFWYHLESARDEQKAVRIANNYALDHGGYVCVKDQNGSVVFGTDPAQLDRVILNGTNKHFPKETARRLGCCVQ
jgi:hypothetical protein